MEKIVSSVHTICIPTEKQVRYAIYYIAHFITRWKVLYSLTIHKKVFVHFVKRASPRKVLIMKKNKKRSLVDLIATATFIGGLCGMIYSGAAEFENEQTRNQTMASSCMSTLVGGLIFTMRSDKQR